MRKNLLRSAPPKQKYASVSQFSLDVVSYAIFLCRWQSVLIGLSNGVDLQGDKLQFVAQNHATEGILAKY